MKRLFAVLRKLLPEADGRRRLIRDSLVFGGIALLSWGARSVYEPAGFIAAGAALFWLGVWGVPRWQVTDGDT